MWKIALGILILASCIAVGFTPISEQTYQHIRIWSHAVWGAGFAIGIVLTVTGFSEA